MRTRQNSLISSDPFCNFGVFFTWNTKPTLRALSFSVWDFLEQGRLRTRFEDQTVSPWRICGVLCPKLASAPGR